MIDFKDGIYRTGPFNMAFGFDFLGYHFSREPLCVANITIKKHVERLVRLYEQQKTKKATSVEMASVLGLYVKRWQRWLLVR